MTRRLCLAALLAAAGLAPERARAGSPLAPSQRAAILVRVLSYDRALRARAGGSVLVAVTYRAGDSFSRKSAKDMSRAFQALTRLKISGLRLEALRVAYPGQGLLNQLVARRGIDAIYVCAGLAEAVPEIVALADQRQVVTFGSKASYVEAGLHAGIFVIDGRAKVQINLRTARGAGLDFDSRLLELAQVLR